MTESRVLVTVKYDNDKPDRLMGFTVGCQLHDCSRLKDSSRLEAHLSIDGFDGFTRLNKRELQQVIVMLQTYERLLK